MKFPGFENALFEMEEFFDKATIKSYKQNSIWFIDKKLIEGFIFLRVYYDAPIIINNWNSNGDFQNRGVRMRWSTTGAGDSQHRKGRAGDFNVVGLTAAKQSQMLIDDWDLITANTFFTTIENPDFTKTWTHIDGRWTNQKELLIVNP